MLRGLWKLTWLEIKIFLREPLGAFGSILFPVLVFVVVSRLAGGRLTPGSLSTAGFLRVGLPVFVSVLIARQGKPKPLADRAACLLYTSDAADE